ncbi:MAG TPA: acetolactate synthase small subunit [Acidimicrobiia bacterium]|nr:acetolactate synthase small subunit [Acidimicrobiia bacterium]
MSQHTLSVIVEDKPGVLARISAMFSNRGFNIHSLAVGPTHVPGRSHITVVVDAPELEQLKKQLHKLVNVIKVTELDTSDALESEVMIARISADPVTRGEIGDTAGLFGARMIDLGPDSITFEVSGTPDQLASFLDHMKPYGVMDLVKSGRVAMKKLSDVARTVVGQA